MTRRAVRPRPAERPGRDAGVTLIEVVVSMSIMAVFMTLFTVGLLQISKSAARNQAIADAQSQVGIAFLRLDKEVRYASGISRPARVGSDFYVEWINTGQTDPQCTVLRLNTSARQLQWRTWNPKELPEVLPWLPLTSDIEATEPFIRIQPTPNGSYRFQRLRLNFVAVSGLGEKQARKATDITFTALNTSAATNTDDVCHEGRSLPS